METRRAVECFIGELNRSEWVREGFPEKVMWKLRPEEGLEISQVEEERVLSRGNGTCNGSEPGRCVDDTVSEGEQVHPDAGNVGKGLLTQLLSAGPLSMLSGPPLAWARAVTLLTDPQVGPVRPGPSTLQLPQLQRP